MGERTGLESHELVVSGDRSELRLGDGRIVIHKEATTQARPTEVEFDVDQVRGATMETPRGGGWLHVLVVGGSPPPPSGLAATGDPYTLPLAGRGTAAARRLVKLVERHVQERGMPSVAPRPAGSSGVIVHEDGRSAQPGVDRGAPPADVDGAAHSSDDVVSRLRALADLHAAGALTDDEFDLAKARVLE